MTPWRTHLAFGLVLVAVLLGMVRIVQYHWREGTAIIGGALLLAAVLRARLSSERVGLLAIRGRGVDVLTYGAFGLLVLAVALTISSGSRSACGRSSRLGSVFVGGRSCRRRQPGQNWWVSRTSWNSSTSKVRLIPAR